MRILLVILAFMLCLSVRAQQNELNFTHQNINFSAAPRTALNPMSIKLWDNYNNGGPSQFGTVLEIYGLSSHQTSQLYFGGWDDSKIRYREAFYAQNSWSNWITLLDSKNNVESGGRLMINGTGNHFISEGNLGIGTTTPNEKLSVNGKIRAHEVKVETANWPDYVFEQDYKLLSLTEIEAYIKKNKHLPEIPSATQVTDNGLDLGEMNKLLLTKVEELTLYLIQIEKERAKEKDVVDKQAKRIQDIEILLNTSLKKK